MSLQRIVRCVYACGDSQETLEIPVQIIRLQMLILHEFKNSMMLNSVMTSYTI